MRYMIHAHVIPRWRNLLSIMLLLIVAIVCEGCASRETLDGRLLQKFGSDGTSLLGEVTYSYSREEMQKGMVDGYGHHTPAMYQELLNHGLSDQELVEGKVVVIVYQTYWHNQSRKHDFLDWAIVEKGVVVNKGNVVEVRLRKPYALVTKVLYAGIGKGDECQLVSGDRGGFVALDAVNLGGGPGTANLYCPKLEEVGWQKTPFGMYKGGFVMTKPSNP